MNKEELQKLEDAAREEYDKAERIALHKFHYKEEDAWKAYSEARETAIREYEHAKIEPWQRFQRKLEELRELEVD